jgi:hypothetical protein
MHCELLVPGLLAPMEGGALPRLPALELLLARGRATEGDATSMEAWLAEAFEVEGLPAGALTLLACAEEPGEAAWARADPVHLRLLRDRAVVVPGEALALSAGEASSLTESLNRHFAGRLEVRAPAPARWVMRLAAPLELPEHPALSLAGKAASPGRADALLTEMQMVLHEHPVNEAREARGEPPVNSVWLWGSGAAPKSASARWHSIVADDPLARGLARAAQLRSREAVSAAAWLDRAPEEGRHLVVLDSLRAAAALGDAEAFGRAAQALEEEWFAPISAALRAGRVGMVTIHVPDAGGSLSVETIRGDLRRMWRRPRPLSAWVR